LPMARENVRRGKSCATKNLPADLENNRTMGITSCNKMLADGPRKRTKRKKLHNQKLASKPRKQSYYRNHIVQQNACRWPEKTYEEERTAQPKTYQQTSKAIVLWERPPWNRVYPLEVDPPLRNASAIRKAKGKQSRGLPVGSRPSPSNILATCRTKVRGVRVYPLEANPLQRAF
ncbi:hypothetical protein PanWU01x14_244320, partial [Parasponia andersonii]